MVHIHGPRGLPVMEAPPLERKLVAIFAADVVGYSRLMEADEEQTLATLSGHRRIVDEAILRHRGRIAGTAGDSVLAELQAFSTRSTQLSRSNTRSLRRIMLCPKN